MKTRVYLMTFHECSAQLSSEEVKSTLASSHPTWALEHYHVTIANGLWVAYAKVSVPVAESDVQFVRCQFCGQIVEEIPNGNCCGSCIETRVAN